MIVPPKEHLHDQLGGYLLNDVEYADDIFTDKKVYKVGSEMSSDNFLFNLLNKVLYLLK